MKNKYELDPAAFKELLHKVFSKHKKQVDWFAEESWWNAVNKYNYQEVKDAFIVHYSQSVYMPFEKDIINIIEKKKKKIAPGVVKGSWSVSMQNELDRLVNVDYLEALKSKDLSKMQEVAAKTSSLERIKDACA